MDCAGWHGTKLVNIYVGNAGSQPGAFWLCYEDPATTKILQQLTNCLAHSLNSFPFHPKAYCFNKGLLKETQVES